MKSSASTAGSREMKAATTADKPLGGGAKRLIDILAATLGIIVLAPLMALLCALIRLESKGPALFAQRRGGFKGRTFYIFKFRTMTTCEDGDRVRQVTRGDERVTRIGAFLRKTSLDELPQLFNVLRGEMSIVGPRPHPVSLDRECIAVEPDYQFRQLARPGITGLAQVSGSRGPLTSSQEIRQRVRLDLAYFEEWSLWSDCWIVLRTVLLVLGDRRQAY